MIKSLLNKIDQQWRKSWLYERRPSAYFMIFVLCALVWLAPDEYPELLAVSVNNFLEGPSWRDLLSLITYQFAHANFSHFAGNFFFATPFALYAERKLGRRAFVNLWLASGIASALGFMIMGLATPGLIMAIALGAPCNLIGASGAICGVFTYACLSYNDKWWKVILGWAGLLYLMVPQFIMMGISTFEPTGIAFSGHCFGFIGALLWISCRRLQKVESKQK